MRTLHGSRSVTGGCVKVQLQCINDGSVIDIDNPYLVARLPINYVDAFSANQLAKWSHLAETNEISIPGKTVGMLIGCDIRTTNGCWETALRGQDDPKVGT